MNDTLRSSDYEVTAIRYATLATTRHESFYRYQTYGEPDAPIQMDYYFWLLRNRDRTVLVDTGFNPDVGRRRGRTVLVEPLEALVRLGVEPKDVSHIILTHLHYDHTGNLKAFPHASLSVPRTELDFWTGPYAMRRQCMAAADPAEIEYVNEAWRAGRVQCIDDGQEIMPGISARIVGGHCPGQQITLVSAEGGPIVLASDALHFYEEMHRDMPFDVFFNLLDMYRAYDILRDLESGEGGIVVAGHDPAVMDRFRGIEGDGNGLAVQITRLNQ